MGKKKKQEKEKKRKEKEEKLRKPDRKEKQSNPERKPKPEKTRKPEKMSEVEKAGKAEKAPKAVQSSRNAKPSKAEKPGKAEKGSGLGKAAGAGTPLPAEAGYEAAAQSPAEIFRALGDENRIRILELLKDGEMCAGDLLKSLSIVQSTLSHHMKILSESGIVRCRRQGKWSYYSIDKEMLKKISIYVMKWS